MRNTLKCETALDEAVARSRIDAYLKSIGYRNAGAAEYVRGKPGGALVATRPHSNHARLTLRSQAKGDQTEFEIWQEVFRYGQPTPKLDRAILRGELDDLQLILAGAKPSIDRHRQNLHAGNVAAVAVFVLVACIFAEIYLLIAATGFIPGPGAGTSVLLSILLLVLITLVGGIYVFAPLKPPSYPLQSNLPHGEVDSPYPR